MKSKVTKPNEITQKLKIEEYKDKTILEVYNENPSYFDWLKDNKPKGMSDPEFESIFSAVKLVKSYLIEVEEEKATHKKNTEHTEYTKVKLRFLQKVEQSYIASMLIAKEIMKNGSLEEKANYTEEEMEMFSNYGFTSRAEYINNLKSYINNKKYYSMVKRIASRQDIQDKKENKINYEDRKKLIDGFANQYDRNSEMIDEIFFNEKKGTEFSLKYYDSYTDIHQNTKFKKEKIKNLKEDHEKRRPLRDQKGHYLEEVILDNLNNIEVMDNTLDKVVNDFQERSKKDDKDINFVFERILSSEASINTLNILETESMLEYTRLVKKVKSNEKNKDFNKDFKSIKELSAKTFISLFRLQLEEIKDKNISNDSILRDILNKNNSVSNEELIDVLIEKAPNLSIAYNLYESTLFDNIDKTNNIVENFEKIKEESKDIENKNNLQKIQDDLQKDILFIEQAQKYLPTVLKTVLVENGNPTLLDNIKKLPKNLNDSLTSDNDNTENITKYSKSINTINDIKKLIKDIAFYKRRFKNEKKIDKPIEELEPNQIRNNKFIEEFDKDKDKKNILEPYFNEDKIINISILETSFSLKDKSLLSDVLDRTPYAKSQRLMIDKIGAIPLENSTFTELNEKYELNENTESNYYNQKKVVQNTFNKIKAFSDDMGKTSEILTGKVSEDNLTANLNFLAFNGNHLNHAMNMGKTGVNLAKLGSVTPLKMLGSLTSTLGGAIMYDAFGKGEAKYSNPLSIYGEVFSNQYNIFFKEGIEHRDNLKNEKQEDKNKREEKLVDTIKNLETKVKTSSVKDFNDIMKINKSYNSNVRNNKYIKDIYNKKHNYQKNLSPNTGKADFPLGANIRKKMVELSTKTMDKENHKIIFKTLMNDHYNISKEDVQRYLYNPENSTIKRKLALLIEDVGAVNKEGTPVTVEDFLRTYQTVNNLTSKNKTGKKEVSVKDEPDNSPSIEELEEASKGREEEFEQNEEFELFNQRESDLYAIKILISKDINDNNGKNISEIISTSNLPSEDTKELLFLDFKVAKSESNDLEMNKTYAIVNSTLISYIFKPDNNASMGDIFNVYGKDFIKQDFVPLFQEHITEKVKQNENKDFLENGEVVTKDLYSNTMLKIAQYEYEEDLVRYKVIFNILKANNFELNDNTKPFMVMLEDILNTPSETSINLFKDGVFDFNKARLAIKSIDIAQKPDGTLYYPGDETENKLAFQDNMNSLIDSIEKTNTNFKGIDYNGFPVIIFDDFAPEIEIPMTKGLVEEEVLSILKEMSILQEENLPENKEKINSLNDKILQEYSNFKEYLQDILEDTDKETTERAFIPVLENMNNKFNSNKLGSKANIVFANIFLSIINEKANDYSYKLPNINDTIENVFENNLKMYADYENNTNGVNKHSSEIIELLNNLHILELHKDINNDNTNNIEKQEEINHFMPVIVKGYKDIEQSLKDNNFTELDSLLNEYDTEEKEKITEILFNKHFDKLAKNSDLNNMNDLADLVIKHKIDNPIFQNFKTKQNEVRNFKSDFNLKLNNIFTNATMPNKIVKQNMSGIATKIDNLFNTELNNNNRYGKALHTQLKIDFVNKVLEEIQDNVFEPESYNSFLNILEEITKDNVNSKQIIKLINQYKTKRIDLFNAIKNKNNKIVVNNNNQKEIIISEDIEKGNSPTR